MEDVPGYCILLKVDSGPGCNSMDFLVKTCFCGLYIFPGLPNATSVQQTAEDRLQLQPFQGRDSSKSWCNCITMLCKQCARCR